MKMILSIFVFCSFAMTAVAAEAKKSKPKDMTITFDISDPTYIDQSKSSSFPNLGYAGCIADEGPEFAEEFFRRSADHTWEVFKGAGAYFIKEWNADGSWARDKKMAYDVFSWRKKHGVKILLCLEHGGGRTINDARRRILGFVKWIVDNGFKDQVAGFELGSEPYWGTTPEIYADRWAAIVPDIKKIWPEVNLGFPVAELYDGDPDIEAVRSRYTNVDLLLSQDSTLGLNKINNWSGRFVVAFSNCLHHCSHVVYHFYGGFGHYGCTYNGVQRIRRFAKSFPEVEGKKAWITEWRFTSDMDLCSQQKFQIALFDALYMLMIVCQPEVEGICAHQAGQLSGGFYIADGKGLWRGQRTHGLGNSAFVDPDWTGRPRIEVGPVGPVFKLYNEALLAHPHVLRRGRRYDGSINDGRFNQMMNVWRNSGEGTVEWVLLTNKDRSSYALMVCNCCSVPFEPEMKMVGVNLARPHYRVYRCRREDIHVSQMPGEPRLAWQEEYDGDEGKIVVPEKSVTTIVFPVKKGAK
jgi:hypothetical protein